MSYNPIPTPLPVYLAELTPQTVSFGTPINAVSYAQIQVQVDSLSGGDRISFVRSLASGGTTYAISVFSDAGDVLTGITLNGLYYIKARGYITPNHVGTSSTPVLTIMANQ